MKSRSTRRKTTAKRKNNNVTLPFTDVTPVAVTSSGSEAVIPATIRSSDDSGQPEAVIPVEVKTATGKVRKRAAVVPITLKTSSKSRNKNHRSRSVRKGARPGLKRKMHRDVGRYQEELHRESKGKQQDVITQGAVLLTRAEEAAVNSAGRLAIAMLRVVPSFLTWPLSGTSKAVQEAAESTEVIARQVSKSAARLTSETAGAMKRMAA